MSDTQVESNKTADPLGQLREVRDSYLGIWAKALGEVVNSDAYSQVSGVLLETALTTSSPIRDAQKKVMISALEQLNMPSRADFVSLAERLSNLELLLDDMDAKLSKVLQLASSSASQPAPKAVTPQPALKIETPQPVLKIETLHSAPEIESQHVPNTASSQPEGETLQPALKAKSDAKSTIRSERAKSAKKGSR